MPRARPRWWRHWPALRRARRDFRDPVDQPFTVWPNIPVIRASDLGDYGQDRQIIADLHADKTDPAKVAAALQAVDGLQAHHERAAWPSWGAASTYS